MLLYQELMQSSLDEAYDEMKRVMGDQFVEPNRDPVFEEVEDLLEEATDKSKVYKENYILRDNLQLKYISDKLKKKSVQDALIEFTGAFIDKNSTALSKSGPVLMFRFGDTETSYLYELFGTSKDEVMKLFDQVIEETYYGKLSKFLVTLVKNAPHKLLLVAILIDAVQNQYDDIIECMEYLFPFCDYPMLFAHYWSTGVKEEVMDYTVEHLPNKFKLKKVSNLQGLLKWDGHSTVSYFAPKISDGQDHWYIDIVYRLRSQMNNTFRNISVMYYQNSKSGATQHKNTNQYDDGQIADNEGLSTNMGQIIDNTLNKFASGSINGNIVKVCAESQLVDKDNLQGFIAQIYNDKTNQLSTYIENIITAYFSKYPTAMSIQASEFVTFGFSLYRSISTSKDPLYQKIRQILNHWMNDIIGIQNLYKREGTRIVYTRAIFNYFILMINYYN